MLLQITVYLLKVICASGLLFLYYHIALRNKRFHYYNRFYLLLTVVISIALPFFKLEWFSFVSSSPQTIRLYNIMYGGGETEIAATGYAAINWEKIALYTMAATSFVFLVVLATHIIKLELLKKKYPVQQFPEFNFINTDIAAAPFSFLRSIFWRNNITLEDETGRQILQHEITHIQQKHSWDKLFMQLLLCFYWINPFFWLLRKELYMVHEFIADEKAVGKNDARAFAKMLITSQYGKFNFLPAQSIFHSPVKRRLFMLTTSKKPQFSYVRRLLVLPLFAIVICLFAFTINKENSVSRQNIVAEKPFVLVVDAGHGGKDYGATGNGLYEKDVTLKIAEKIKQLAPQFGINVLLTRDEDVTKTPQERSTFSNAQNAGAFVSIHVNSIDKAQQADYSGFEIYISKKNSAEAQGNQLLGSAILQNISTDFKTAQALNLRKAGIWVVDNSTIPTALIECGYISNAEDAQLLKDNAKIELMAKNILQGVAMYANNSFDKSALYQIKNEVAKDTTRPVEVTIKSNEQPLFFLDGKAITKAELDKIDPKNIESVNVLKDKNATDKYGDKGKNGIVEVILKSETSASAVAALYVVDGIVVSKVIVDKIDPNNIKEVNVLKDKMATDKYNDKGKNGVIEITLKQPLSAQ